MISPRVFPDDGISVLSLVGFGVPGSDVDPQLRINAVCACHLFWRESMKYQPGSNRRM